MIARFIEVNACLGMVQCVLRISCEMRKVRVHNYSFFLLSQQLITGLSQSNKGVQPVVARTHVFARGIVLAATGN